MNGQTGDSCSLSAVCSRSEAYKRQLKMEKGGAGVLGGRELHCRDMSDPSDPSDCVTRGTCLSFQLHSDTLQP